MNNKFRTGLIGLGGIALTFIALFANSLGIGKEPDWGPGRIMIALLGVTLILSAVWMGYQNSMNSKLIRLWTWFINSHAIRNYHSRIDIWGTRWNNLLLIRWYVVRIKQPVGRYFSVLRNTRLIKYFASSQDRIALLAGAILGMFILTIHVWFVSVGFWTEWPNTTTYYSQLADGFLHGEWGILAEPSAGLLALEDPYDYENRSTVSYPWDIVLYNGKFYLYWGPVPALVLCLFKLFYNGEIGDQFLVFGFMVGIWFFASKLMVRMRNRLFSGLPWYWLVPGILMAGLAHPFLWILGRPAVYEAAITGGQFFLLAGLYFGFTAFDRDRTIIGRLSLAGACMSLAIGCRASLAPVAVFVIGMVIWHVLSRPIWFSKKLIPVISATSLFIAGAFGIGYYNKARFGSWFEFGFQYQLTGMNTHQQTFSLANLPINVHNYFINPYKTLSDFPYIIPDWDWHFIFFQTHPPPNYYAEQAAGLILAAPYLLLGVVPLIYSVGRGWYLIAHKFRKGMELQKQAHQEAFDWTAALIVGSSVLAFAPLLLFISATMRYLGDVVPMLVLASTFGFMQGASSFPQKPFKRNSFFLLGFISMLYSIIVSFLFSFTGCDYRIEKLNPFLFYGIIQIFSP